MLYIKYSPILLLYMYIKECKCVYSSMIYLRKSLIGPFRMYNNALQSVYLSITTHFGVTCKIGEFVLAYPLNLFIIK